MSFQKPLSAELEAQAQALLSRIRENSEDELLALARLLVSKEDRELFGDTEFEARDIVHRIGAQAFEARLEKKTATKVRASSAQDAGNVPSSKGTARKRR